MFTSVSVGKVRGASPEQFRLNAGLLKGPIPINPRFHFMKMGPANPITL